VPPNHRFRKEASGRYPRFADLGSEYGEAGARAYVLYSPLVIVDGFGCLFNCTLSPTSSRRETEVEEKLKWTVEGRIALKVKFCRCEEVILPSLRINRKAVVSLLKLY
jgi:hypothetical protein